VQAQLSFLPQSLLVILAEISTAEKASQSPTPSSEQAEGCPAQENWNCLKWAVQNAAQTLPQ